MAYRSNDIVSRYTTERNNISLYEGQYSKRSNLDARYSKEAAHVMANGNAADTIATGIGIGIGALGIGGAIALIIGACLKR